VGPTYAQRTSINRPAGTPVWHDENITQAKYRELLLQKVFPAIMVSGQGENGQGQMSSLGFNKMVHHHISIPKIQHLLRDYSNWGSTTRFYCIHNLGFFCALQSEYYKMTPGNAGHIIQFVQHAYHAYMTSTQEQ
jgi:hypothetical protein